ncbi:MAG: nicotinate phosphoribosyltransferase [Thermoanaerobaculia bacterium]
MTQHAFSSGQSLALTTDLYELTMAYGYWKEKKHQQEVVFNLFFRNNPFGGGFTISCGLAPLAEYIRAFRFSDDDLGYLETLKGNDERPLFDREFLDMLSGLELACDIDAIPEGTVVFPYEPLLRVKGSILEAQILESVMLNVMNFQSLIATKAARIEIAAGGEPILEFGLRRAQGLDGALSASRAAYVGGAVATSNLLAGKLYGIPVAGTHAHSWVMLFPDELDAFQSWARSLPNNCVFLVDTYDTMAGIRHAIDAGRWLEAHGHRMIGIRLDSGDLAYLSIEARKMLDAAGFTGASIVASNELDEEIITSLKLQGAKINVWGVGTRLVTGWGQPALGGIYKLTAVRDAKGEWEHKLKVSEESAKISTPGILQVRRFFTESENVGDMIFDELLPPAGAPTMIHPTDMTRRKSFGRTTSHEDLLVPLFRHGQLVSDSPSLQEIRERVVRQLKMFHPGIKRFVNPHVYPVGLEQQLHKLKTDLILTMRERPPADAAE